MTNLQNCFLVQSKKSTKCKLDKPTTDFHRKTSHKTGFKPECKICVSAWQKQHYSNPEISNKRIERQRKPKFRMQQRRHHLKNKYNISLDDYEKMLHSQNNSCFICKTTKPSGRSTKYFHVDHCHTSGKVRGLLCYRCNGVLGLLEEDLGLIDNLIEYIRIHDVKS